MRRMLLMLCVVVIAVPCVSFAQESPIEAVADAVDAGGEAGIPLTMDLAVKSLIGLVFAWLAKFAVGKKWMQNLLEGLEVGVNQTWEDYVKPKKLGNKTLSEDDKKTARSKAADTAKAVMGIGAKVLMAVTPQAKVAALISGIVNRRKREAKAAK